MGCSRYQELLLEQFGQGQLDSELQGHLATCPACRTFWKELAGLSDNLGNDDLFSPDEIQVEQLVMQVGKTIGRARPYKRNRFSFAKNVWLRYIPAAAAAALVLGVAIGGYMAGKTAFSPEKSELVLSQADTNGLLSDDNAELDEATVGTLIYDFATENTYEAGEWLLDDLTEEELKYLEKSFNVGDLL
jgi:predicted anti-sigma-YlaC factor YlaD